MRNLDLLLEKAKWDKLSKDELAEVVQRIKQYNEEDSEDLYTLLHTLGRSGAWEYRSLVEPFLSYTADPMIPRIALKTLCDYWNLTSSYLDILKEFITGVEWDEDAVVRVVAISISGEYIRTTNDKSLLRLLLDIFENEKEEIEMRSFAYEAIARGIGVNYDQLPPVTVLATFSKDVIDQAVVDEAYRKLE